MEAMQNRSAIIAASTLALGLSASASAQSVEVDTAQVIGGCGTTQECLTTVLDGVVGGFLGEAGGSLWGWMLGGSASGGTDGGFNAQLQTIAGALEDIRKQLEPNGDIVTQLKKLQCSNSASWIDAGPASTINLRTNQYQNFLSKIGNTNAANPPLGESSSNNQDVTTLYGWANKSIQETNGNTSLLEAIVTLNTQTIGGIGPGTIHDCVNANGNAPASGSLDDRPYYDRNVLPI